MAAGFTAAASALVASPAFALVHAPRNPTPSPAPRSPSRLLPQVDDRLNGDGAGIALGVNDPVLGAHLLGVFTAIWALYYIANNSDGFLQSGGKDDDSGLSL